MGLVLRREVNDIKEARSTLSYINDSVMFDDQRLIFTSNWTIKTSYTFAIGTGSSVKYPRAMFLDGKQVYPPIANVQLFNLHGSSTNNGEFTLDASGFGYYCMHQSMPHAYLFPKSIKAVFSNEFIYEDGDVSNHARMQEVEIPSFNPVTSNNWSTKYAYYMENSVYIKDSAVLPYKFPEFDENGTYTYIGREWPSDVLSELNLKRSDTADDLANAYFTSGAPLAYNNIGADYPTILRREYHSINAGFSTVCIPPGSRGSKITIYYNSQPISNSIDLLLMPKVGTTLTQGDMFDPRVSGWSGNNPIWYDSSDHGTIGLSSGKISAHFVDLFFIRVTPAQVSSFSNIIRQKKENTSIYSSNIFVPSLDLNISSDSVNASGAFGSPIDISNNDVHSVRHHIPHSSLAYMQVTNTYTNDYPALKILYDPKFAENEHDIITYYRYEDIYNNGNGFIENNTIVDINELVEEEVVNVGIDITMTSSASLISHYVLDESSHPTNTYAYLYACADIVSPWVHNNHLMFTKNRVITPTYFSVYRSEIMTSTQQKDSTYITTMLY